MKIGNRQPILDGVDVALVLACIGFVAGMLLLAVITAIAVVAASVVAVLVWPIAWLTRGIGFAGAIVSHWWERT